MRTRAACRIIFFAHPRSGSSSLYEILQLHPDINILEEPFNENFVRWQAGNKNYRVLVHDLPSLNNQLAEIFSSFSGLKLLDYQLPDELAVPMLQRPDCRIIFLRRRNLLQAVVSGLIAQQTQLWKKWEMDKPLLDYYGDLQPLAIDDVQKRIAGLKRHLDFFETVLQERPSQTVLKLTYEELFFSPTKQQGQQIEAIWQFLGVATFTSEQIQTYLRPDETKLNSAATYDLLPNAREIDACCGNDETGWLYG